MIKLGPAPSSRDVTPSSGKEVPFNITIHDAKEGGKKRCKQCPQWIMTAANYDGGNDEEAGGSDVGHVVTATRSGKCQARLPIDHFERLLEEACPNYVYLIKQKLKDSDMIKNFMVSGSLTRGMELDEDLDGSDAMPFPGEDMVMMAYDGHPPSGRCHITNLSPGTPTRCGWGPRNIGV
jgi:hypothetical protein